MASSFALPAGIFPASTVVTVYESYGEMPRSDAPPLGEVVTVTTTDASGAGVLGGLNDGVAYWAVAQIAGQYRWAALTTEDFEGLIDETPPYSLPFAQASVTATTTAAAGQIPARTGRTVIELVNTSTANGVWVTFGTATPAVGNGTYLAPSSAGEWTYDGALGTISVGGSAVLSVVEW